MSEQAIIAVNDAFYQAFSTQDVATMDELWAREHPVFCVHPGWAPLMTRRHVIASWRDILTGPSAPDIRHSDAVVHTVGDLGYVVCIESLGDGRLTATNIFVREALGWKICHHQATPIAYQPDIERPPPEQLN